MMEASDAAPIKEVVESVYVASGSFLLYALRR